jgi:ceramide glucosyltransferase
LRDGVSWTFATVAACGAAYLAVALVRTRAFAATRPPAVDDGDLPGISVLKPLHSLEPELAENLESLFAQEYPAFQVVLSAVDESDPALAVARAVLERFPDVDAEIVVQAAAAVANPKIANASNAVKRAKHDVIAIADADIRVPPGYLRAVGAAFVTERAGAVTCLYGATSATPGVAELAALQVNDHFAPSVLVANAFEPLRYCFGSTMAVRRDVLERIGGLAALGATIADDHRLGELVSALGERVVLAPCVVTTLAGETSLAAVWSREVRWARTVRALRPLDSTLAVVTMPLPFALAASLLAPRSFVRLALVTIVIALRFALHVTARDAFATGTGRSASRRIVDRDFLTLGVWAWSRFGSAVTWQEARHSIGEHGALR